VYALKCAYRANQVKLSNIRWTLDSVAEVVLRMLHEKLAAITKRIRLNI
jgi:hypothetical protein